MSLPWTRFPPEIRSRILGEVSAEYSPGYRARRQRALSGLPKASLTAYARVSKEWQVYFEAITFRHLVVQSSDLRISWQSTWEESLEDGQRIISAISKDWKAVAKLRSHRDLVEIKPLPIRTEDLREHDLQCILDHLDLKRLVYDPRTILQLEAERKHGVHF